MTIQTLFRFLFGGRQAIHHISNNRILFWVGLVFVISAGFAREYDGEDLLHEPWHLMIPLAASVVSSLLLFLLAKLVFFRQAVDECVEPTYLAFLNVYWMTAPLAWIYAIPVERLVSAPVAVELNLWFLAIVATWRVLLITRVISVMFGRHAVPVFFTVMLFADALVLVALYFTPLPVISLMGGIRLSESEKILQSTAFFVGFGSLVTLPVWLLGTCVAPFGSKSNRKSRIFEPLTSDSSGVSWGIGLLAACALLVWLPILPSTQAEQQNRRRVERLMRGDRVSEALEYMSSRSRADFPPHWDPPPRIGYGEIRPPLWQVVLTASESRVSDWVRALYFQKLADQSLATPHFEQPFQLDDMNDEELGRYVKLIENSKDRDSLAKYHTIEARNLLASHDHSHWQRVDANFSASRRASLKAIIALAEVPENQKDD